MSDVVDNSTVKIDLAKVLERIEKWRKSLPLIKPYYAVKCNDNSEILKTMADMGLNFDCASKNEISQVLAMGVDPSRIIYANPCKQISHIRYAAQNGIKLTTFDSLCELRKIQQYAPQMQLLLRLSTDDSKAVCKMSQKYGACLGEVPHILKMISELNLRLVGFAFHIGSASEDKHGFSKAISMALEAFDIATQCGLNPHILDIGGGFPGDNSKLYNQMVHSITRSLSTVFKNKSLEVISEPGRFFVSSAVSLECAVIGYKELEGHTRYYLSDGLYGALSCVLYDHASIQPKVLRSGPTSNCSLWGPTCDGLDCILRSIPLPKLEIGDVVIFKNMGAYSTCSASSFNGLYDPIVQIQGRSEVVQHKSLVLDNVMTNKISK